MCILIYSVYFCVFLYISYLALLLCIIRETLMAVLYSWNVSITSTNLFKLSSLSSIVNSIRNTPVSRCESDQRCVIVTQIMQREKYVDKYAREKKCKFKNSFGWKIFFFLRVSSSCLYTTIFRRRKPLFPWKRYSLILNRGFPTSQL